MARIIHNLQSRSKGRYHIYTDLDFWDTRRILARLARVKRNFGTAPPGDQFPTQVVVEDLGPEVRREIEKRLTRAIASPPRHLIVQSIVFAGKFEFDRRKYYPDHWSPARVIAFTRKRLPMNQPVISSPYKWVDLSIHGNTVTITQHQGTPPKGTERQTKGGKVETWGPSCI
jgi:hypothetical protein